MFLLPLHFQIVVNKDQEEKIDELFFCAVCVERIFGAPFSDWINQTLNRMKGNEEKGFKRVMDGTYYNSSNRYI